MGEPVYVDKAEILAQLRYRQLHARADWVDRSLPALIDTHRSAALLRMLGIDLNRNAGGEVVGSGS
jgi:hypothetical protein